MAIPPEETHTGPDAEPVPAVVFVVSFEIELQTSRETPLNIGRFTLVFSSFQIGTT